MNDRGLKNIIICIAFLLFWPFLFWGNFISVLRRYNRQRPAVCLEGRRVGSSNTTQFNVDEWIVFSSERTWDVNMMCQIPIAVYPCYDEVDETNWRGNCQNLALTPLFMWPNDYRPSGVTCSRASGSSDHENKCEELNWVCEDGRQCSATAKALEACAANVARTMYACYYTPEKHFLGLEKGLFREHSPFPWDWLICAMISTVLLLIVCLAWAASLTQDAGMRILSCFGSCTFAHILWGLIFITIIYHKRSVNEPKTPLEQRFPETAAHWSSDAAPEDAPYTDPATLKVVLALFLTALLLFFLVTLSSCLYLYLRRRVLSSSYQSQDKMETGTGAHSSMAVQASGEEGQGSEGDDNAVDVIARIVVEEAEATHEAVWEVTDLVVGIALQAWSAMWSKIVGADETDPEMAGCAGGEPMKPPPMPARPDPPAAPIAPRLGPAEAHMTTAPPAAPAPSMPASPPAVAPGPDTPFSPGHASSLGEARRVDDAPGAGDALIT